MSIQQKERDKIIENDPVLEEMINTANSVRARMDKILVLFHSLIIQRVRRLNLQDRTDHASESVMRKLEREQLKRAHFTAKH